MRRKIEHEGKKYTVICKKKCKGTYNLYIKQDKFVFGIESSKIPSIKEYHAIIDMFIDSVQPQQKNVS